MMRINPDFMRCSGSYRTLRRDIDAARNAVTESWSNGQTEGQINRLKTLKRAMYRPSESGTLACAHDAVLAGVTHRE